MRHEPLILLALVVPWVAYAVIRACRRDRYRNRPLPPPSLESLRIGPTAWRTGTWR